MTTYDQKILITTQALKYNG